MTDSIVLTEAGDVFTPQPSVTDESTLVGKHSCEGGGAMHLFTLSRKWQVLCCKQCCLRIEVPHGLVRQPEAFRQWCAEQIRDQKRERESIQRELLWKTPLK